MSQQRLPTSQARSPDIILHSSLAQNLYRRLAPSPSNRSMSAPGSSAGSGSASKYPPGSGQVPGNATVPSPANRDRTRSGGQTPREMVWVDSKERLSEMATNIRGISTALSNVALSVAVKNILIVTKLNDDDLPPLTREMVEWLLQWQPHSAQPDGRAGSQHTERRPDGHAEKSTKASSKGGRRHPLSTSTRNMSTPHSPLSSSSLSSSSRHPRSTSSTAPQFWNQPGSRHTQYDAGSSGPSVEANASAGKDAEPSKPPSAHSSTVDKGQAKADGKTDREEHPHKEKEHPEVAPRSSHASSRVSESTTPQEQLSRELSPNTTETDSSATTPAQSPPPHSQSSSPPNEPLEIAVPPKSCSIGNLQIYVEDELAMNPRFGLEEIKKQYPQYCDRIKLWDHDLVSPDAEKIDLIITLGGDGTVLYTSWLFQKMVPPTLSFGLGSLGFMTENEFQDFPSILDEFLTNGICCTLRMRFKCTVMRTKNAHKTGSDDLKHEMRAGGDNYHFESHTKDGSYTILNEVVVDRGPNPFVTMTELYGNFELLTSIKADGVVISTPTGSTAYSMSAGGSLVHPDIPAQLISPICPHTLSFRPLVVPDSMILHIGVPYDARSSAFVSFDGKARVELRRGDFLAINVSRYPFPKVLPARSTSISWVQQLSRTLHWNEQKRPKRYTDGSSDNWYH